MTAPAPTVGLLPPGETGAAVGAALRTRGVPVRWVGQGRSSQATRLPEAARPVAEQVVAGGFQGVYVDANAISPESARTTQTIIQASGASLVDGGIIGGPPEPGGVTHLYFSGAGAPPGAALFEGSDRLTATVLEGPVGAASALKLCYPAWTKGTTALLLAVRAAATALGGEEALLEEWKQSQPELAPSFARIVKSTPRKAWRFVAEMEQIAETWEAREVPGGFHRATAEVYARLSQFQNQLPSASLDELLGALQKPGAKDMAAESRPVPPDPCGPY